MFNKIDEDSFVVNKVEPAQKNNLKNQQNNGQTLSDYRKKLNMQRTFLELLKENGVEHVVSKRNSENYKKRKK